MIRWVIVIFLALVLTAFAVAAVRQLGIVAADPAVMGRLAKAIIDDAGQSVTIALGLVGVMALFLGVMKVAEAGGLLKVVARLLRPPAMA